MRKISKIKRMTDQEWAEAASWLSGEDTGDKETARILLEEDPDLLRKWNEMKMMEPHSGIDVDKAWAKLNRKIEQENTVKTGRILTMRPLLLRVAAMIIIVFGLGWGFYKVVIPEKVTVASAANEKNIVVTLPDGSKVYLNRDSHLTYPESFGKNSRKVTLKGEAFFNISHDASRPFTIDAGEARVRVLGTSFNVITDNGNNEVEVYVSTGKVLLTNSSGTQSLTLEPGYVGRVSADNGLSTVNTNANYLSWNTGILKYDGERLEAVFHDLKRVYNIDITTSDPVINDFRVTTQFDNQPQDTIIKVICTTFNLQSDKEGEVYTLSRR